MGGFAYHNAAPNADRKKDATHGVAASDQLNAAAALPFLHRHIWGCSGDPETYILKTPARCFMPLMRPAAEARSVSSARHV